MKIMGKEILGKGNGNFFVSDFFQATIFVGQQNVALL